MPLPEKIFNLDFKTFIRSPFAYLFFIFLIAIGYLGRVIITSKDSEIVNLNKQVQECDEERKYDKKLLQDIVFQKQLNDKIENGR
jgi:hypothetical protein